MNGIASGKVFIDTPSEIFSRWPPLKVIQVTRGHQQFFANNLRSKWETWDSCHCVCLRKAYRMMYNLTYLGHRVALPWLDLRSNFDLDLSRSNYTLLDAPWRDKHDRVTIVVLSFKTKTLSPKNQFGQIWHFDLWWPQFWPELKNDRSSIRIIFLELSNTVFRFVLRCAGAEIDGGCSNTPPPHQVVENPEAHQGAG